MRMSWVAAYAKGSEHILQQWLWKMMKDKTAHFGPLLKVFRGDNGTAPTCGTDAWTHIFTLYPLAGAAITHKLLACGLEKCLTFKDDSTANFTAYVATVNESASHLGNMPTMSVTDIYALVTLMGLHLSSSERHEKAYSELIACVDEGNALTLEKVQQVGLKYDLSRHPVARTFELTSDGTAEVCNHSCPRCSSWPHAQTFSHLQSRRQTTPSPHLFGLGRRRLRADLGGAGSRRRDPCLRCRSLS
jgi:hypothetical protein